MKLYFVETSSHVDGRLLDDGIDDIGQRRQEIRGGNFGVEKDLGTQESLKANIDIVRLFFFSLSMNMIHEAKKK